MNDSDANLNISPLNLNKLFSEPTKAEKKALIEEEKNESIIENQTEMPSQPSSTVTPTKTQPRQRRKRCDSRTLLKQNGFDDDLILEPEDLEVIFCLEFDFFRI